MSVTFQSHMSYRRLLSSLVELLWASGDSPHALSWCDNLTSTCAAYSKSPGVCNVIGTVWSLGSHERRVRASRMKAPFNMCA